MKREFIVRRCGNQYEIYENGKRVGTAAPRLGGWRFDGPRHHSRKGWPTLGAAIRSMFGQYSHVVIKP